ncbi:MAG: hypothetical protein FJ280_19975 [Planctomycetes bacterium]|nr:hypothetical protein [Planctomycetota bacterium]
MNEGKRPGGLTALAVINFILVGLSVMSLVGMAALFSFADRIPTDEMAEAERAQFEAFQNMGTPMLVFILALTLLSAVLLLLSGIGYLKQKRILGRMVGNIYGITAIISSIVSGLWFAPELGGGFNIGTIIGLIYPIVTLVLINTTFKDDLTN